MNPYPFLLENHFTLPLTFDMAYYTSNGRMDGRGDEASLHTRRWTEHRSSAVAVDESRWAFVMRHAFSCDTRTSTSR